MTGRLPSVPPETVARTINLICAPRVMVVERALAADSGAASRRRCAWRIVVSGCPSDAVASAWVSAGFAGCLGEGVADPVRTGGSGLLGGAGDVVVEFAGQPHAQQR